MTAGKRTGLAGVRAYRRRPADNRTRLAVRENCRGTDGRIVETTLSLVIGGANPDSTPYVRLRHGHEPSLRDRRVRDSFPGTTPEVSFSHVRTYGPLCSGGKLTHGLMSPTGFGPAVRTHHSAQSAPLR